jgi:CRP-like cAMP-binding protein
MRDLTLENIKTGILKEPLKYIYRHPLLSEEELEKIWEAHTPVQFKKNEILLREGQTAAEYYLVEEGLIRAFLYDYDNNEITTEFFCVNEIVIIPSSLFQKKPSKENLQAVTPSKLWKIEYEKFQALFHAIEGFREWGRVWFSFQVFNMKQRSLDMITETASNRYLKLLREKPQIVQQAPLKQIASYLGITDTSLSRIRRQR